MAEPLTGLWLKNPLAVYTGDDADGGGGLVIDGAAIVEVVPAGQQPRTRTRRASTRPGTYSCPA